jgi:hypothetical protein
MQNPVCIIVFAKHVNSYIRGSICMHLVCQNAALRSCWNLGGGDIGRDRVFYQTCDTVGS